MDESTTGDIYDGVKGKIFRYHGTTKYWLWQKRKLYCSQKHGVQNFLHRVIWEERHGPIPAGWEIYSVGEIDDLTDTNWRMRKRNSGRPQEFKYKPQIFDGKRFHRKPPGYFKQANGCEGDQYMHRYVWNFFHGPIPKGREIHHKDGDRGNNHISNLELLTILEHRGLHAKIRRLRKSEQQSGASIRSNG